MSVTGMLACGMVLVIIAGEIDLSVGSLLGLLGGLAAILTVNLGWNTWLAVAAVLPPAPRWAWSTAASRRGCACRPSSSAWAACWPIADCCS